MFLCSFLRDSVLYMVSLKNWGRIFFTPCTKQICSCHFPRPHHPHAHTPWNLLRALHSLLLPSNPFTRYALFFTTLRCPRFHKIARKKFSSIPLFHTMKKYQNLESYIDNFQSVYIYFTFSQSKCYNHRKNENLMFYAPRNRLNRVNVCVCVSVAFFSVYHPGVFSKTNTGQN